MQKAGEGGVDLGARPTPPRTRGTALGCGMAPTQPPTTEPHLIFRSNFRPGGDRRWFLVSSGKLVPKPLGGVSITLPTWALAELHRELRTSAHPRASVEQVCGWWGHHVTRLQCPTGALA